MFFELDFTGYVNYTPETPHMDPQFIDPILNQDFQLELGKGIIQLVGGYVSGECSRHWMLQPFFGRRFLFCSLGIVVEDQIINKIGCVTNQDMLDFIVIKWRL